MKNAIEIENLTKKYDGFALGKIDLNIPSGMIIGLIGENGAGKTTLIKSILNIIKPKTGRVKVFDKDYSIHEIENKNDIGVVLDDMFFPEILTPKDINSIMKNIYANWDTDLYYSYLKQFDLPLNKTIKNLSKGMRKKIEIITALSHHPKLLILDEPTSGLDPVVRSEILDIFMDFIQDEDHTILLSTHITSDLERIADYIVFMDGGKIVLNEKRDEILDNYGILKVDLDSFELVEKEDIIRYCKTKYNYEILIGDRKKIIKKYKKFIVDKISLEDLMIFYIKGVK